MSKFNRLGRDFYARSTLDVARELLGKRLVRIDGGRRIAGIILETEAYIGEADQGCHARAGRTPRTQVMYGPPGHSYVYFTYGMHWMLNFVTEQEGFPAAVLIRAIHPTEGLDLIAVRRDGRPPHQWTDGPAKLCQALGIDGAIHGCDLCAQTAVLYVEEGDPIPEHGVTTGPRVGLNNVPKPWKSIPWRFLVSEDYSPQSTRRSQRYDKDIIR
jgi:DNA-3-methyladenine glycosylase